MSHDCLSNIEKAIFQKRSAIKDKYCRHVPMGDLFTDRWDTAKFYGFGEGSSCYNNVLIIGDVKVGRNTWIGPNVILDGSGGLEIGDFCAISAGVQIYTHNSVDWSNSLGVEKIKVLRTTIGDGVFIGPNSVIQMGVKIGDKASVGALSFVNKPVECGQKVFGSPAKSHD